MKKRRESPVVQDIGDIMLARVGEVVPILGFGEYFRGVGNSLTPTSVSAVASRLPPAMAGVKSWVFVPQFEGQAGEEFQEQASQLCSQHSQAVELIKNKKRKDPRFAQIIQVHTHTHTH